MNHMPDVHLVLSRKGGTGKTTVALNLAAVVNDVLCHDATRNRVLVISTDPQASTAFWSRRVERVSGRTPFDVDQVLDPNLLAELPYVPAFRQYRHVFIDTPGSFADEQLLQAALAVSTDALVPMPPEPLVYDVTRQTIEQVLRPFGLPYTVVINAWDPRDGERDLIETREYVAACGWALAGSVVRRYKVHTRASAAGQVCTQYPENRTSLQAREDFFRLALELGLGGGAPAAAITAAVAGAPA